jgi:hypothetical protein
MALFHDAPFPFYNTATSLSTAMFLVGWNKDRKEYRNRERERERKMF